MKQALVSSRDAVPHELIHGFRVGTTNIEPPDVQIISQHILGTN